MNEHSRISSESSSYNLHQESHTKRYTGTPREDHNLFSSLNSSSTFPEEKMKSSSHEAVSDDADGIMENLSRTSYEDRLRRPSTPRQMEPMTTRSPPRREEVTRQWFSCLSSKHLCEDTGISKKESTETMVAAEEVKELHKRKCLDVQASFLSPPSSSGFPFPPDPDEKFPNHQVRTPVAAPPPLRALSEKEGDTSPFLRTDVAAAFSASHPSHPSHSSPLESAEVRKRPKDPPYHRDGGFVSSSPGIPSSSGCSPGTLSSSVETTAKTLTSAEEFFKDCELLAVIGSGSYGKVFLVRKRPSMKLFAVKQIRKQHNTMHNNRNQMVAERQTLTKLKHPFVVALYQAVQSVTRVYFILEFGQGGDFRTFQSSFPWVREMQLCLNAYCYPFYTEINKEEVAALLQEKCAARKKKKQERKRKGEQEDKMRALFGDQKTAWQEKGRLESHSECNEDIKASEVLPSGMEIQDEEVANASAAKTPVRGNAIGITSEAWNAAEACLVAHALPWLSFSVLFSAHTSVGVMAQWWWWYWWYHLYEDSPLPHERDSMTASFSSSLSPSSSPLRNRKSYNRVFLSTGVAEVARVWTRTARTHSPSVSKAPPPPPYTKRRVQSSVPCPLGETKEKDALVTESEEVFPCPAPQQAGRGFTWLPFHSSSDCRGSCQSSCKLLRWDVAMQGLQRRVKQFSDYLDKAYVTQSSKREEPAWGAVRTETSTADAAGIASEGRHTALLIAPHSWSARVAWLRHISKGMWWNGLASCSTATRLRSPLVSSTPHDSFSFYSFSSSEGGGLGALLAYTPPFPFGDFFRKTVAALEQPVLCAVSTSLPEMTRVEVHEHSQEKWDIPTVRKEDFADKEGCRRHDGSHPNTAEADDRDSISQPHAPSSRRAIQEVAPDQHFHPTPEESQKRKEKKRRWKVRRNAPFRRRCFEDTRVTSLLVVARPSSAREDERALAPWTVFPKELAEEPQETPQEKNPVMVQLASSTLASMAVHEAFSFHSTSLPGLSSSPPMQNRNASHGHVEGKLHTTTEDTKQCLPASSPSDSSSRTPPPPSLARASASSTKTSKSGRELEDLTLQEKKEQLDRWIAKNNETITALRRSILSLPESSTTTSLPQREGGHAAPCRDVGNTFPCRGASCGAEPLHPTAWEEMDTTTANLTSIPPLPDGPYAFASDHSHRMPLSFIAFYALELALGIAFLHGKDCIYRDLKPANLLLRKDGHLLLSDFGVAKDKTHEKASRISFSRWGEEGNGHTEQHAAARNFTGGGANAGGTPCGSFVPPSSGEKDALQGGFGTNNYMSPEVFLSRIQQCFPSSSLPSPPPSSLSLPLSLRRSHALSSSSLSMFSFVSSRWRADSRRGTPQKEKEWEGKRDAAPGEKEGMNLFTRKEKVRLNDTPTVPRRMSTSPSVVLDKGESQASDGMAWLPFGVSCARPCCDIPTEGVSGRAFMGTSSSASSSFLSSNSTWMPSHPFAASMPSFPPTPTSPSCFTGDHLADWWSYGCVLFEWGNGRLAFDSDTILGLHDQITQHDIVVNAAEDFRLTEQEFHAYVAQMALRYWNQKQYVQKRGNPTARPRSLSRSPSRLSSSSSKDTLPTSEIFFSSPTPLAKATRDFLFSSCLVDLLEAMYYFKHLTLSLLQRDPKKRRYGFDAIVEHPFFHCPYIVSQLYYKTFLTRRRHCPSPPPTSKERHPDAKEHTPTAKACDPQEENKEENEDEEERWGGVIKRCERSFWGLEDSYTSSIFRFIEVLRMTLHRPANWKTLFTSKRIDPAYAPYLRCEDDLRYFPSARNTRGDLIAQQQNTVLRAWRQRVKEKQEKRRARHGARRRHRLFPHAWTQKRTLAKEENAPETKVAVRDGERCTASPPQDLHSHRKDSKHRMERPASHSFSVVSNLDRMASCDVLQNDGIASSNPLAHLLPYREGHELSALERSCVASLFPSHEVGELTTPLPLSTTLLSRPLTMQPTSLVPWESSLSPTRFKEKGNSISPRLASATIGKEEGVGGGVPSSSRHPRVVSFCEIPPSSLPHTTTPRVKRATLPSRSASFHPPLPPMAHLIRPFTTPGMAAASVSPTASRAVVLAPSVVSTTSGERIARTPPLIPHPPHQTPKEEWHSVWMEWETKQPPSAQPTPFQAQAMRTPPPTRGEEELLPDATQTQRTSLLPGVDDPIAERGSTPNSTSMPTECTSQEVDGMVPTEAHERVTPYRDGWKRVWMYAPIPVDVSLLASPSSLEPAHTGNEPPCRPSIVLPSSVVELPLPPPTTSLSTAPPSPLGWRGPIATGIMESTAEETKGAPHPSPVISSSVSLVSFFPSRAAGESGGEEENEGSAHVAHLPPLPTTPTTVTWADVARMPPLPFPMLRPPLQNATSGTRRRSTEQCDKDIITAPPPPLYKKETDDDTRGPAPFSRTTCRTPHVQNVLTCAAEAKRLCKEGATPCTPEGKRSAGDALSPSLAPSPSCLAPSFLVSDENASASVAPIRVRFPVSEVRTTTTSPSLRGAIVQTMMKLEQQQQKKKQKSYNKYFSISAHRRRQHARFAALEDDSSSSLPVSPRSSPSCSTSARLPPPPPPLLPTHPSLPLTPKPSLWKASPVPPISLRRPRKAVGSTSLGSVNPPPPPPPLVPRSPLPVPPMRGKRPCAWETSQTSRSPSKTLDEVPCDADDQHEGDTSRSSSTFTDSDITSFGTSSSSSLSSTFSGSGGCRSRRKATRQPPAHRYNSPEMLASLLLDSSSSASSTTASMASSVMEMETPKGTAVTGSPSPLLPVSRVGWEWEEREQKGLERVPSPATSQENTHGSVYCPAFFRPPLSPPLWAVQQGKRRSGEYDTHEEAAAVGSSVFVWAGRFVAVPQRAWHILQGEEVTREHDTPSTPPPSSPPLHDHHDAKQEDDATPVHHHHHHETAGVPACPTATSTLLTASSDPTCFPPSSEAWNVLLTAIRYDALLPNATEVWCYFPSCTSLSEATAAIAEGPGVSPSSDHPEEPISHSLLRPPPSPRSTTSSVVGSGAVVSLYAGYSIPRDGENSERKRPSMDAAALARRGWDVSAASTPSSRHQCSRSTTASRSRRTRSHPHTTGSVSLHDEEDEMEDDSFVDFSRQRAVSISNTTVWAASSRWSSRASSRGRSRARSLRLPHTLPGILFPLLQEERLMKPTTPQEPLFDVSASSEKRRAERGRSRGRHPWKRYRWNEKNPEKPQRNDEGVGIEIEDEDAGSSQERERTTTPHLPLEWKTRRNTPLGSSYGEEEIPVTSFVSHLSPTKQAESPFCTAQRSPPPATTRQTLLPSSTIPFPSTSPPLGREEEEEVWGSGGPSSVVPFSLPHVARPGEEVGSPWRGEASTSSPSLSNTAFPLEEPEHDAESGVSLERAPSSLSRGRSTFHPFPTPFRAASWRTPAVEESTATAPEKDVVLHTVDVSLASSTRRRCGSPPTSSITSLLGNVKKTATRWQPPWTRWRGVASSSRKRAAHCHSLEDTSRAPRRASPRQGSSFGEGVPSTVTLSYSMPFSFSESSFRMGWSRKRADPPAGPAADDSGSSSGSPSPLPFSSSRVREEREREAAGKSANLSRHQKTMPPPPIMVRKWQSAREASDVASGTTVERKGEGERFCDSWDEGHPHSCDDPLPTHPHFPTAYVEEGDMTTPLDATHRISLSYSSSPHSAASSGLVPPSSSSSPARGSGLASTGKPAGESRERVGNGEESSRTRRERHSPSHSPLLPPKNDQSSAVSIPVPSTSSLRSSPAVSSPSTSHTWLSSVLSHLSPVTFLFHHAKAGPRKGTREASSEEESEEEYEEYEEEEESEEESVERVRRGPGCAMSAGGAPSSFPKTAAPLFSDANTQRSRGNAEGSSSGTVPRPGRRDGRWVEGNTHPEKEGRQGARRDGSPPKGRRHFSTPPIPVKTAQPEKGMTKPKTLVDIFRQKQQQQALAVRPPKGREERTGPTETGGRPHSSAWGAPSSSSSWNASPASSQNGFTVTDVTSRRHMVARQVSNTMTSHGVPYSQEVHHPSRTPASSATMQSAPSVNDAYGNYYPNFSFTDGAEDY